MSLTMPPLDDIADLLRRRNIGDIPADQRTLLERDDSWAVDLNDSVHNRAHVPGHVLETVKKAHIARKNKDTGSGQGQSSESNSPHGSLNNTHQRNGIARSSRDHHYSSPPSSPEVLIDWAASSPHLPPQELPDLPSSIVRETPKNAPMAPLLQPGLPPQAAPSYLCPSSDNEVEDLDMELPQAQAKPDAPVTRGGSRLQPLLVSPFKVDSTQSINTPPCAQPVQPVIPRSLAENEVPPPKPVGAEPRRSRRMKPILLSDESPRVRKTSTSASFARMSAIRSFEQIDSSTPTSSGSVIPATFQSLSTQASVTSTAPAGPGVNGPLTHTSPKTTSHALRPAAQIIPSRQPEAAGLSFSPVISTIETADDTALDPFTTFTAAYPTYISEHAGNLRNFVKACICLEFLRKERGLRECLYDDFIRAFSSGFLTYVTRAGLDQEPLPAIEWFNNMSGPSIFNTMTVTKQNLNSIFESYPEEVTRSRALIKGDDDEEVMEGVEEQEEQCQTEEEEEEEGTMVAAPDFGLDGAMDVDEPEEVVFQNVPIEEPASSPRVAPPTQLPGPPSPRLPRSPSPRLSASPSPQLGSESIAPPSSTPAGGLPRSRLFRPSQYFNRLASSQRSNSNSKGRSVEEQARLREHFRKRKSSATASTPSTRGASREHN